MGRKAETPGPERRRNAGPRALRELAGRAKVSRRDGFTLIEIVVAVGAVALVAVGLASIFDTVGKTVTGGRRVSVLNTYAGLLERQMRADFDHLSRDGFLVIRQQWVDGSDGAPDGKYDPASASDRVPVSPDDVAPRGRRIDEMLFFVNGQFASGRQPTWPGVQATSGLAEVYYGHGQTAAVATTFPADPTHPTYRKRFPRVDDRNAFPAARLGIAPGTGQPADGNPNYYAGNWTLLRHVTLLSRPATADSLPVPVSEQPYGFDPTVAQRRAYLMDQPTQVALQPAASSIFRSIATFYPNGGRTLRVASDGGFGAPFLASGIVDIAATDLNEVRSVITGGATAAGAGIAYVYPYGVGTATTFPLLSKRDFLPISLLQSDQFSNARPALALYTDLDRMQAWMSDAFPTDSRNKQAQGNANDFPEDPKDRGNLGTRMRYEPDSADLMTAMSFLPDGTAIPTVLTDQNSLALAEARGDQLLLGSSNLVPHCSEFIVEWSFGNLDINGHVVWHGPTRQVGADTVRTYPWDSQNVARVKFTPVGEFDSTLGNTAQYLYHPATDRLIYGFSPIHNGTPGEACLTSYFGWTDPTYVRPAAAPAGFSNNTAASVPWPWPRMIRVTITLSDPQEPTIESTFQYVFTTPADPK